jgi:hypothetical protein
MSLEPKQCQCLGTSPTLVGRADVRSQCKNYLRSGFDPQFASASIEALDYAYRP